MIKIEMATEVSADAPTGQAGEYIWMIGQPWPVPFLQEQRVMRIEVWGPELDFVKHLPGGTEHANGLVRQWTMKDAVRVSQELRTLTAENK